VTIGFMRPTRTQHIVYTGVDNHVHELWWVSDGWTASVVDASRRDAAVAVEQSHLALEERLERHGDRDPRPRNIACPRKISRPCAVL
jgi:hypothetical protein